MQLENIYQFFQNPPPTYLAGKQAMCYILSVLLQEEACGTNLIERIEKEHPQCRLSDTILYSSLKFLEDERALLSYWQTAQKRGRPRRMYRVDPQWIVIAQDLADLWQEYASRELAKP